MEEVVLEREVEGGGSHVNKEEEEEQDRLSGSILKDDSIVLFETNDEEENDEKDLLGSAPDLEEDQALKAKVTTLHVSTTFKHQEEDSARGVDCGVNQDSSSQSIDTIVQLLSKQQLTDKATDEEKKSKVDEDGEKNEAEDQKLVIELLRQQVDSLYILHLRLHYPK